MRSPILDIIAAIAAYVALTVALSWPLGAHLATHLPHEEGAFTSDLHYVAWALAWQTHALLDDPARFAHANVYSGAPLALFYGTPGFALLPLFAPVYAATGNVALATNCAFLLSIAATAAALHLVVASWTGSRLAGIAAGGTFLSAPAALGLCAVMPQFAAMAPTPVIAWMLARESVERRGAVALAGLLVLQALTDVVYVAVPVLLTVALVAGARLARGRPDGRRIVVALLAAVAALIPIYAGYLAVRLANPDLRSQTVWIEEAVMWMNALTWLPGAGNAPLMLSASTFLPVIAGLVLWSRGVVPRDAARSRAWRQAALWFGVSFALSWVIPLVVPGLRDVIRATMAREVVRLGFPGLAGICLLVGLGTAACLEAATSRMRAWHARAIVTVALALWLGARVSDRRWGLGSYPAMPAPVAGPEAPILRAGTGLVLELPVGDPRLDTRSHAAAMYRSTAHWRPLVNGYSSYHPRDFRERIDLARMLPTPFAVDAFRRAGVTNIVVHAVGMRALTIGRWEALLDGPGLRGVRVEHRDDEVLVLAVLPEG